MAIVYYQGLHLLEAQTSQTHHVLSDWLTPLFPGVQ